MPARISKSNLLLRYPVAAEEHACERYAMWFSTLGKGAHKQHLATFFHGWEGQTPLSLWNMLKISVGSASARRLLGFSTRTWDESVPVEEVPMAYISQPGPNQCLPLLGLSYQMYFGGAYDRVPLKLACHSLGCGGSVREAALSGQWAVLSLLRGFGWDIGPALRRHPDPVLELLGLSEQRLVAELPPHTS